MRRRRLFISALGAVLASVLPAPAFVAAASDDTIVDLAINGLPLLSPEETEPVLAAAEGAVVHAAASTLFTFVNADGSQTLTLTVHPGSERYSIAVVNVGYANALARGPVLAGEPQAFVTRKGIRLGMARAEVEALIGEPAYIIGDAAIYELSGESALLKRYNMPIYRAAYGYEDDRLTGFRFGFPYP